MLEINIELMNGVIDNLEYLKKIYYINPDLKVPLSYISPAISQAEYNFVIHQWDKPTFYRFVFSSIYTLSRNLIEEGREIFELIRLHDDYILDTLYEKYLYEEDIKDEEDTGMECQGFIEYLTDYQVYSWRFKFSFISKYSKQFELWLYEIMDVLLFDCSPYFGEKLIGYDIDEKTCEITIFYMLDTYHDHEYELDIDFVDLEKRFIEILKDEVSI